MSLLARLFLPSAAADSIRPVGPIPHTSRQPRALVRRRSLRFPTGSMSQRAAHNRLDVTACRTNGTLAAANGGC